MITHSFAPFDRDAVQLLTERIGIDYRFTDFASDRWLCVTGRRDGELLGCCMFEFPVWFDAYFSIAVIDPRCITRRVMRAMFRAVFSRAVRVSAEIPPDQTLVIAKAQRMGFIIEGLKAKGIDGRRDALLLGMTEDTCQVLRRAPRGSQGRYSEVSDGQSTQSA
jgi:hypothetical protein